MSTHPNKIPTNQDRFWEAEYKLQNCLRITLNVESFTVEVESMPGHYEPVSKYVVAALQVYADKRVAEARIDELNQARNAMEPSAEVPYVPSFDQYTVDRLAQLKGESE